VAADHRHPGTERRRLHTSWRLRLRGDRRRGLRFSQRLCPRGTCAAGHPLGANCPPRLQLAPAHVDLSHAGLPPVRPRSGQASPHEPRVPPGQRLAAVCGPEAHDRLHLAQFVRHRAIRPASAARGVCGVDIRAQGCPQHVFHATCDSRLRSLHGEARRRPLGVGFNRVRAWPDGEADARLAADHPPAARLLAAQAVAARSRQAADGKDAALPAVRRLLRGDLSRAAQRRSRSGTGRFPADRANRQCDRFIR